MRGLSVCGSPFFFTANRAIELNRIFRTTEVYFS